MVNLVSWGALHLNHRLNSFPSAGGCFLWLRLDPPVCICVGFARVCVSVWLKQPRHVESKTKTARSERSRDRHVRIHFTAIQPHKISQRSWPAPNSTSVCELSVHVCACQGVARLLPPLLQGHITSIPFYTPTLHPARLFLQVGSHGCSGQFLVPSFPVADCRGGSGCHASLTLTSCDSSTMTGRGLLDRAQSATPQPSHSNTCKQINIHTYCREHTA